MWLSKGHSRPRDRTGRDKLGGGGGKKATERGAPTNWRSHWEGQVGTRKEGSQTTQRGTHILETVEEGTIQERQEKNPNDRHSQTADRRCRDKSGHGRKRPNKGYSHPGGHREKDESGCGKTATERRALTSWRPWRGRQVKTQKESYRERRTHILETAPRGTSQYTEIKRPSEGHSRTGNHRGRDK